MIEIISKKIKSEWHLHKCPRCKKVKREPNEVCTKVSGDHVFICLDCMQDYRLRLGTDVLLDAYLEQYQLDRLQHFAPDEKANVLDLLDAYRRDQQLAELAEKARNMGPVKPPTPAEKAQAKHEALDKMRDEAEVLTYDEVVAETEKIKEQERI